LRKPLPGFDAHLLKPIYPAALEKLLAAPADVKFSL
jgi:hypothetical protein